MPPPVEASPRHNTRRTPEGVHVRPRHEAEVPVQEQRQLMPMEVAKQQLADAILAHDVVVLRAGTGSGKSTSGPTIVLEALQKANPRKRIKILVAEPRQILAESISKRVAELNNVPWGGDLVGFYHGDDQKYSKEKTQIVYTVDGSLKNRIKENLAGDPALEDFDAWVVDEIHLRNLDQEAILIGFKEVQKRRKSKGLAPLKFVITSAGAQQEHADYYDNSVLLDIPGAEPKYRVDKKVFLPSRIDFKNVPLEMGRLAAEIIQDKTHYGDVVGFLPGKAEIDAAQAEFDRIMREKGLSYKSASLMGGGGPENKATQAILGDKDPERQPIAAFVSAVGEAGATFARLTKVIDSGKSRVMVYDEQSGLERLETKDESFDEYTQRLGRLARVADGEYYGMFPEVDLTDESKHPKVAPPSILREDIVPFVLSLKAMGIIDVHNIDYINNPGKEKLDKAIEALTLLGALNPDGTLNQVGQDMEKLRYDPHFARMLVEAKKRGCVEAVSTIIGFLNSKRSVFAYNPRQEKFTDKYKQYIDHTPHVPKSDYLTLLNVWNAYINKFKNTETVHHNPSTFDLGVLQDVNKLKSDILHDGFFKGAFGGGLGNLEIDVTAKAEAIMACVVAGFRDRLLKRSGKGYDMAHGARKGILPDQSSIFTNYPADMLISGLIYAPLRGGTYAGMNQEITREFLNKVTPYAVLEAEAPKEAEKHEENHVPVEDIKHEALHVSTPIPGESHAHTEAQAKKPSFIKAIQLYVANINKSAENYFARIRKFFGGK